MMEWLSTLGITQKQQKLYMYLLEHGSHTASELAGILGEQRTNIYLLAEDLEKNGLLERDASRPVVRFLATNPNRLQRLMTQKQHALAESATQLKKALPEMTGLYQINSAQPGLAYFEGIKGYSAALEDMIRSEQEVCVFGASNVSRARPDAWDVLQNKLQKRALAKVRTRILFEQALQESTDIHSRQRQRMQVRFWGDAVFDSEVAVYGSTVVLTTYDDKLSSLVIKNQSLANTLQSIFDTAWIAAKQKTS